MCRKPEKSSSRAGKTAVFVETPTDLIADAELSLLCFVLCGDGFAGLQSHPSKFYREPFCCLFRFFQGFHQHIAEFLRGRDLDPAGLAVKLRVSVTPLIVFLFGDLSCFQFRGLRLPASEHIKKIAVVAAPGLVQTQTDFSINLTDLQVIHVLQGKQGVHHANVAVNVRQIEGLGRYIQSLRQLIRQIGFWCPGAGFILRHTDIGGLLRKAHQRAKIFLRHTPQIAEALGKHLAADVFESYSAGTELKDHINQDAVRLMKELYHIDMEAEGQHSKLLEMLPPVDGVITMGCNVQCPFLPCKWREGWGLDDPTGQSDEVFRETIRQIEQHIRQLKIKIQGGVCHEKRN